MSSDWELRELRTVFDGIERRALLYVPSSAARSLACPLVVMLHGAGGSPESAIEETDWLATAQREKFAMLFPEATRPVISQPVRFGRNNPAWNDGSGRFHSGEQNIPDVEFMDRLVEELFEQKHGAVRVDRDQIFVTGFSNGASMAFRMGVESKFRIAAIAPVAGSLWVELPRPTDASCESPWSGESIQLPSLLYITGTEDPLNPMLGGLPQVSSSVSLRGVGDVPKPSVLSNVTRWSEYLGCTELCVGELESEQVEHRLYRGERDGARVEFIALPGHGHIWPGGRTLLPPFMVGRNASRFDANGAIARFFLKSEA